MKALISIVLFSLLITGCALNPKNDHYQVTHEGTISGYAYHDYALKLSRNDQLTVNLNTYQLDVIIISPIKVMLDNDQPFTVQSDDEYTLRILMPRALARRNETHPYQLSITVDRN